MIGEASTALAHLDASALEELGRRAEALAQLNLGDPGVGLQAQIPVLEARFRVFAALLKATGENLATLQRAEAKEAFGRDTYGSSEFSRTSPPRGLFESFGLYNDGDVGTSIWPVGLSSNAKRNGRRTGRA